VTLLVLLIVTGAPTAKNSHTDQEVHAHPTSRPFAKLHLLHLLVFCLFCPARHRNLLSTHTCPHQQNTLPAAFHPLQVCRTTLLPSALKTLAANRGEPLPLRLFELSDVVLLDSSRDVGARNERRLLAVTCGKTSEFDAVHGLLNRVMQVLGVPYTGERGLARCAQGGLPCPGRERDDA
jgi:hypothetical protein